MKWSLEFARERATYRTDRYWPRRPAIEGPENVSSGELAAYRMAHPEVTTPSEKIARCLCWLEREFAP